MLRDQKLKMKKIGVLVANLLSLDKKKRHSLGGLTLLTLYFWNECTRSLRLKFQIFQDLIWAI